VQLSLVSWSLDAQLQLQANASFLPAAGRTALAAALYSSTGLNETQLQLGLITEAAPVAAGRRRLLAVLQVPVAVHGWADDVADDLAPAAVVAASLSDNGVALVAAASALTPFGVTGVTAAAPPERSSSASRSELKSSGRPARPCTRKKRCFGSAATEAAAAAGGTACAACAAPGARNRRVANDSSGAPKGADGGGEAGQANAAARAMGDATRPDASPMRRGSVIRGRATTMRRARARERRAELGSNKKLRGRPGADASPPKRTRSSPLLRRRARVGTTQAV
jgi:hypothetical protein